MQKDNRTTSERKADAARGLKRFLRATKKTKLKWVKKESVKKRKIAEERAFQNHMARLAGKLGI